MIKSSFFFLLCFTFYFFLLPQPCEAARQRARKPRDTSAPLVSRGVRAYVRFRPDRRALLISFSNFGELESGRYELIYEANGVAQGAGGSIILGDTDSKTLVFGTESSGVFNYHNNITNARLSIVSVLKDGTTVLKPFRIRI